RLPDQWSDILCRTVVLNRFITYPSEQIILTDRRGVVAIDLTDNPESQFRLTCFDDTCGLNKLFDALVIQQSPNKCEGERMVSSVGSGHGCIIFQIHSTAIHRKPFFG